MGRKAGRRGNSASIFSGVRGHPAQSGSHRTTSTLKAQSRLGHAHPKAAIALHSGRSRRDLARDGASPSAGGQQVSKMILPQRGRITLMKPVAPIASRARQIQRVSSPE